jgi:putative phosphoribosyl transferase
MNVVSQSGKNTNLTIPLGSKAIILFAHGSGSSRHSTRNQHAARVLNHTGFATLLVDLLTTEEEQIDETSRHLRFDIDLLARRIMEVTEWLTRDPRTKSLRIGYFASSTGAAAAMIAAAKHNDVVKTIVSRGGRLDLADSTGVLQSITFPVLLIVGGNDDAQMIRMNKNALKQLSQSEAKELAVIPYAGHLFEEPDKMKEVAKLAVNWFEYYLVQNGRKFVNPYHKKKTTIFSSILKKGMMSLQIKFKDRIAAGEILALLLDRYMEEDDERTTTAIGIPRGGVIVADIVATKIDAELDIVIPRKLRAPDSVENSIGAIMQDSSLYLDSCTVQSLGVSDEYIQTEKREQKKKIEKMTELYDRPKSREYKIKGRTVFLVDDGAATGATIIAAARWIRKQEPQRLIIAVPVAPSQVVMMLRNEADAVEAIRSPSASEFASVEQFYQDFDFVPDERVSAILERRYRLS